ncbi:MAG: 50S ribosomal protein L4 [Clostridia bacterium]|nr:50S ribosomal protein L4 [Clostridia bacterium]
MPGPRAPLYSADGERIGEVELPEAVFGRPAERPLLKQAVVVYLANQRQGTHATRTRGEVRGGGRKPWRQKHTGRARQGSIRAPHWRKGGIVFGPVPRDHRLRLPRRMRRRALVGALSLRAGEGGVVVLRGLELDRPRTRRIAELVAKLPRQGRRLLLVTAGPDPNVYLSARNLPEVDVLPARDLHPYAVLRASDLAIAEDAIAEIEGVLAR